MGTSATIAASFPAGPLSRPLRRLCDRLGLDIRFDQLAAGLVQFRRQAGARGRDWDIVVLRAVDWMDAAPDGRGARRERFAENLSGFLAGLDGPGSPAVGSIVCLYPSPPGAFAAADVARCEAELADRLSEVERTTLITSSQVVPRYRVGDATCQELDGEPVYGNELHTAFAAEIARVVHAAERRPVKVIAVDADYTLWEGACAESGERGLRLGPGRESFQRMLLERRRQGVLLCLFSQNAREDVVRAFDEHDFPLTLDDFAIVEAGWAPKPTMLRQAAADLNLAPESFVFVDDNPGECVRMRTEMPAVHTLRFPQDDKAVGAFMEHAWLLDPPGAGTVAVDRTEQYRAEVSRRRALEQAADRERFLADLDLRLCVRQALPEDVPRIVQMSDRVTQFNTCPSRRTPAAVARDLADDGRVCLVVEVADRFGDYGLTGVLEYSVTPTALHVWTWLLSCRVLHREVEHRLLRQLADRAAASGVDTLVFEVRRTDRNGPARSFLTRAGAEWVEDGDDGGRVRLTVEAAASPPASAPPGDPLELREPEAGAEAVPDAPLPSANVFLAWLAEEFTGARALYESLFPRREDDGRPRTLGLWSAMLKQAWEEVLGVEDVWHQDDLFGVWGATSVDVLKVCARIGQRCGVTLTLGEMLALPTVAQQAENFMQKAPARIPVITRLRGGHGVPLVFLPPAGGLAYGYLELIRALGDEQTVLIAQAPELTGDETLLDLDALVRVYRQEIRRLAGGDPVVLAGWSFGAILAYETAVAVEGAGGAMAGLVLFDPPRREPPRAEPGGAEPGGGDREPAPGAALGRFFEFLDPRRTDAVSLVALDREIFPGAEPLDAAVGREAVWRALLARLLADADEHQRNRLLIPELAPLDVLRGACVWKKNQELARAYRPTPGGHRGRSYVFAVADGALDGGPDHVLAGVLGERTETRPYPIRPVAGLRAHSAMMEKENVALFAPDVSRLMAELRSEHSRPGR
ncbi:HAD-IIIC family phosphatase [Actinomadura sp. NPDC047616]|uniref:HAD-IIIC family phosphatase n=1 Tax=Actinomadura sp. NPDC047616 TaxID=3155914 RepID=UPI0034016317